MSFDVQPSEGAATQPETPLPKGALASWEGAKGYDGTSNCDICSGTCEEGRCEQLKGNKYAAPAKHGAATQPPTLNGPLPLETQPRVPGAVDVQPADDSDKLFYDMDTNPHAVKAHLHAREQKLTRLETHRMLAHTGPHDGKCLECRLVRGNSRRIFKKCEPFVPTQPMYWIAADIVTFDAPSRHGHRYAVISRCMATGYYLPIVWLSLKSDALRGVENMVQRLRRSPLFAKLPYPPVQQLRLDPDGVWREDNVAWQKMCVRIGIECEYTSPPDKRSAAHAEVAILHLVQSAKAIMLSASLPALWVEEAMEQARSVRNCLPIQRDVVSRDGDAPRPLERVTCGIVSRRQCSQVLHHTVPVGVPAIIFDNHVKGSSISQLKGQWVVCLGGHYDLPLFYNPFTGRIKRSKVYHVHTLLQGQNFYDFYGLVVPAASFPRSGKRAKAPNMSQTIEITGLSKMLGPPAPYVERTVVRFNGIARPRCYVRDPLTGDSYTHDDNGQFSLVPTADAGPGLHFIDKGEPRPPPPPPPTPREHALQRLRDEPMFVVSARFCKKWLSADGVTDLGDCTGVIMATSPDGASGDQQWRALYPADGHEEWLTRDEVIHYVIDSWVTPMPSHDSSGYTGDVYKGPTVLECMRGNEPAATGGAALSGPAEIDATPADVEAVGTLNPYVRVPETKRNALDIHTRRRVHWNKKHVCDAASSEGARHATYTVRAGDNWVRVCDEMGVQTHHRRLYWNWLGADFGPDARRAPTGFHGVRFLSPWEGGRRKAPLPTDSVLPSPEGPSWTQWLNVHEKETLATPTDNHTNTRAALDAEAGVVAKLYCAAAEERDNHECPIVNLSETEAGDADTVREHVETAHVRAVSATAMAKHFNISRDDPRIRAITGKDGKIAEPFAPSQTRGRIDEKEWWAAIEKEWAAICEKEVFSEPMTLAAIRALGVTSEPCPVRYLLSVKHLPDGAIDRWKARLILIGSGKHMRKFEHFWKTYSTCPHVALNRLLSCVVVEKGYRRCAFDIKTAFLHGKCEEHERVPIIMPRNLQTYDKDGNPHYFLLKGNLYGAPFAPRTWIRVRNDYLLKEWSGQGGWTVTKCLKEPSLFVFKCVRGTCAACASAHAAARKKGGPATVPDGHSTYEHACRDRAQCKCAKRTWTAFCGLHSDDGDMCYEWQDAPTGQADWMKTEVLAGMQARFGISEGDPVNQLGLSRTMNESGTEIHITMTGFVDSLWEQWRGETGKLLPKTPFPPHLYIEQELEPDRDAVLGKALTKRGYPQVVGSLLWASRMCYPECAVGCSYLARVMSCPTQEAWDAAMHMVKYLQRHRAQGIKFSRQGSENKLIAYYDASNRIDYNDGCAIGGHALFLSGGPLEWVAQKLPKDQPGQSSSHCEYLSLSHCSKSVSWMRDLLEEMGLQEWCKEATWTFGDNDTATNLAREDLVTRANRYYKKDAHFSKKAFECGVTNPLRVCTADNLADPFTKSLPVQAVERLVPSLKGHAVPKISISKFDVPTVVIPTAEDDGGQRDLTPPARAPEAASAAAARAWRSGDIPESPRDERVSREPRSTWARRELGACVGAAPIRHHGGQRRVEQAGRGPAAGSGQLPRIQAGLASVKLPPAASVPSARQPEAAMTDGAGGRSGQTVPATHGLEAWCWCEHEPLASACAAAARARARPLNHARVYK